LVTDFCKCSTTALLNKACSSMFCWTCWSSKDNWKAKNETRSGVHINYDNKYHAGLFENLVNNYSLNICIIIGHTLTCCLSCLSISHSLRAVSTASPATVHHKFHIVRRLNVTFPEKFEPLGPISNLVKWQQQTM
jgi:hypothetical protein